MTIFEKLLSMRDAEIKLKYNGDRPKLMTIKWLIGLLEQQPQPVGDRKATDILRGLASTSGPTTIHPREVELINSLIPTELPLSTLMMTLVFHSYEIKEAANFGEAMKLARGLFEGQVFSGAAVKEIVDDIRNDRPGHPEGAGSP